MAIYDKFVVGRSLPLAPSNRFWQSMSVEHWLSFSLIHTEFTPSFVFSVVFPVMRACTLWSIDSKPNNCLEKVHLERYRSKNLRATSDKRCPRRSNDFDQHTRIIKSIRIDSMRKDEKIFFYKTLFERDARSE